MRLDLSGRRSNRIHALHPLPQQFVEQCVVAAFVFATQNQVDVRGKGFQRLEGRVHIRRLRIVVVIHAAYRRHKLQPVLDRLELAHSLPNLFCRAAHERTRTNRRQHVFQIVRPLQRNLRNGDHFALLIAVAKHDAATANKRPSLHFLLPAEPEHLSAGSGGHGHTGWIVGIQDDKVTGILVLEDPRFRGGVGLERAVTIQMVRSNVQHDRNLRVESLNRLQLKARHFEHGHCVRVGAVGKRNRGCTDVAAHEGGNASFLENFTSERCGRRLAVRSRDGNDRAGQESGSQFDLADHRNPQRARLRQRWRIHGNSGAYHN